MDVVKSIILTLIESKSKKGIQGFHQKFTNEHFLDIILYVLKNGLSWRELKGKAHFTIYHKKFKSYCRSKIFQEAFYLIVKLLKKKKKIGLKNLFIDSSMIKNIKGIEEIGVNHYDRGKNGNKISLIVTNSGIPLGMKLEKSNVHDITLTEDTIKDIKIKVIRSRLIADKGYVSGQLKKTLKDNYKIRLVTPLKKNSKGKLRKYDRELLSTRNIVENTFSWIKANRRIQQRYDKSYESFQQFIYLALIKIIGSKSLL